MKNSFLLFITVILLSGCSHISIKPNIYEFEVKEDEFNKKYLYCIDNDRSYPMSGSIIKDHELLSFAEENEIYESMQLYGVFTRNEEIDKIYTYNPQLNIEQKETLKRYDESIYKLIEKENTIGTFINKDHIIKTNIEKFSDLVIGNDYVIKTNSTSLVLNSKDIEYLITPISIEESNKFNKSNDTIEVQIYCVVDSYDGMPRYDSLTGKGDFSTSFWYSKYESCDFYFVEPISFNEIMDTTTLKDSLYCSNDFEIYSSYRGFDIFYDENKNNYKLDKNQEIIEDCIIFIGTSSNIIYM